MESGDTQGGYDELLANIRRLTIMVLDDLDAGSRDKTLDYGEKRRLSSTGARLLRLWRNVVRDGGSKKTWKELEGVDGLLSDKSEPLASSVEE